MSENSLRFGLQVAFFSLIIFSLLALFCKDYYGAMVCATMIPILFIASKFDKSKNDTLKTKLMLLAIFLLCLGISIRIFFNH